MNDKIKELEEEIERIEAFFESGDCNCFDNEYLIEVCMAESELLEELREEKIKAGILTVNDDE